MAGHGGGGDGGDLEINCIYFSIFIFKVHFLFERKETEKECEFVLFISASFFYNYFYYYRLSDLASNYD